MVVQDPCHRDFSRESLCEIAENASEQWSSRTTAYLPTGPFLQLTKCTRPYVPQFFFVHRFSLVFSLVCYFYHVFLTCFVLHWFSLVFSLALRVSYLFYSFFLFCIGFLQFFNLGFWCLISVPCFFRSASIFFSFFHQFLVFNMCSLVLRSCCVVLSYRVLGRYIRKQIRPDFWPGF